MCACIVCSVSALFWLVPPFCSVCTFCVNVKMASTRAPIVSEEVSRACEVLKVMANINGTTMPYGRLYKVKSELTKEKHVNLVNQLNEVAEKFANKYLSHLQSKINVDSDAMELYSLIFRTDTKKRKRAGGQTSSTTRKSSKQKRVNNILETFATETSLFSNSSEEKKLCDDDDNKEVEVITEFQQDQSNETKLDDVEIEEESAVDEPEIVKIIDVETLPDSPEIKVSAETTTIDVETLPDSPEIKVVAKTTKVAPDVLETVDISGLDQVTEHKSPAKAKSAEELGTKFGFNFSQNSNVQRPKGSYNILVSPRKRIVHVPTTNHSSTTSLPNLITAVVPQNLRFLKATLVKGYVPAIIQKPATYGQKNSATSANLVCTKTNQKQEQTKKTGKRADETIANTSGQALIKKRRKRKMPPEIDEDKECIVISD